MASNLREIVDRLGKKSSSSSLSSKFDELRRLVDKIEEIIGPDTSDMADNEDEQEDMSPTKIRVPQDMDIKKSIAIAVLRKKNKGMR